MTDLRKTSDLIEEARQNLLDMHSVYGHRKAQGDQSRVIRALIERLELILEMEPPDGWFMLGSHLDYSGPLEFSDELDDDGLPKWERHA